MDMKKGMIIAGAVVAGVAVVGGGLLVYHNRKFKVGDQVKMSFKAEKGDLGPLCITEGSKVDVRGEIAAVNSDGTVAMWWTSITTSAPFSGSCKEGHPTWKRGKGVIDDWSLLYFGQPGVAPTYTENGVALAKYMPAAIKTSALKHIPL